MMTYSSWPTPPSKIILEVKMVKKTIQVITDMDNSDEPRVQALSMSNPDVNVTSASAASDTGSAHASLLWIPYVLIALVFIVFLGANFWCYHKKHRERYLRKRDEKRVKDGLHERRRITALMRSHFQSAFMSKNSDMNGGDSGSEDREVEKGGLSPAAGVHTVYNSISVHHEKLSPLRQHGVVCNSFSFEDGKVSPSSYLTGGVPTTSSASFESDSVSPVLEKGKGGSAVCHSVFSEKGKAPLVRQKEIVSHSVSIPDCRLSPVVERSPRVKRYGYDSISPVTDKLSPLERKDPVVGLHHLNSGSSKTGKVSPVETQAVDSAGPPPSSNSVAPLIRKLPPLRSLKNTAFPRAPTGSFADKLSPVYSSRFSPSSSVSREFSTSKTEDKLSPSESTQDNNNVSEAPKDSHRSRADDNLPSPVSAREGKPEVCRDCSPSGVDNKVIPVSPTRENNNSDSPNNNLPSGVENKLSPISPVRDTHSSGDRSPSLDHSPRYHYRPSSNKSVPARERKQSPSSNKPLPGPEIKPAPVNPKEDINNSSIPNDSVSSVVEDCNPTDNNNPDTSTEPLRADTEEKQSRSQTLSSVSDSVQTVVPQIQTPEPKNLSPAKPVSENSALTNQDEAYKSSSSDVKIEAGNGAMLKH